MNTATVEKWIVDAIIFVFFRHFPQIVISLIGLAGLMVAGLVILSILGSLFGGQGRVIEPSGVFGSGKVETEDAVLKAAGLIGTKWGYGIRLGRSVAGSVIRLNSENSLGTFGPPGSGKYVSVIAAAMAEYGASIKHGGPGGSCLIVDEKGQIAAGTLEERARLGRVIVIAPFLEGLPKGVLKLIRPYLGAYNPMQRLLNPQSESFQIQSDGLAEILTPDDASGESANTGFFTSGARHLISGVMMHVMDTYPKEKQNLAEVASIICTEKIYEVARLAVERGNPYVIDRVGSFAAVGAHADKTKTSILETARRGVRFLSDPNFARVVSGESNWGFDDFKRTPCTVYLIIPARFLPMPGARDFFRLFAGAAINELMATPRGKVPCLLVLDEFAQLKKFDAASQAVAHGRDFGVRLWIFCQSTAQLKQIYGDNGFQNFLAGMDVEQHLAPRDFETAGHISRASGRCTRVTEHYAYDSVGRESKTFPEHDRPVISPEEAINLGRDEFILFARSLAGSNAILGKRLPYWEDPDVKKRMGTNPYFT